MALYLCLNADGTGIVSEQNPIQTKHTSNGEPVTIPVYIFNDGKRKGVANDQNPPPLVYTNLQIKIEGVGYLLETALSPSLSDVTLFFDSVAGWNIGTIIKSGTERMRVEEVLTATSIRVQRNYTADGKPSTVQSHSVGAMFISECDTVSLALPSISDYNNAGTFLNGGVALTSGVDPSNLINAIDDSEKTTTIRSNKGSLYHVNSLIKIDQEIMKVVAVATNELTVIRGYNSTKRSPHSQNAVITCVGIVDITPVTHKFFLKNDPPTGLPTQKKRDVKVVIVADEEPQ